MQSEIATRSLWMPGNDLVMPLTECEERLRDRVVAAPSGDKYRN